MGAFRNDATIPAPTMDTVGPVAPIWSYQLLAVSSTCTVKGYFINNKAQQASVCMSFEVDSSTAVSFTDIYRTIEGIDEEDPIDPEIIGFQGQTTEDLYLGVGAGIDGSVTYPLTDEAPIAPASSYAVFGRVG